MADVITRLKVESSEYDAKLKRATAGIQDLEESCRKAGTSLNSVSNDNLKFVQSLGNMEAVAKSTRGKINEMTQSFTELSMIYNRLSDDEKKGTFGVALSQSLDTLKGRINDSKAELDKVTQSLNNTGTESKNTGGILGELANKFGLNITKLTGLGAALGASTAALKVAKDAFFASESNLDSWNRMVYSAQITYEAFLTSINTGDIGGFLTRIDTIVKAAKEAYDAMDHLATQKAINNPKLRQLEAERERQQQMLRTGRYVAPEQGSGLKPSMTPGQVLTPTQMKNLERQLEGTQRRIVGLYREQLKDQNNVIRKLYDTQAKTLNMSYSQFLKGISDMETFDKNVALSRKYYEFETAHTKNVRTLSPYLGGGYEDRKVRDNAVNPYKAYMGWKHFKDDGELFGTIQNYINERAATMSGIYSSYGQIYRTIDRADARIGKMTGGVGGSHGGRVGGTVTPTYVPVEGSIDAQYAKVQALQKAWRAAADDDSRQKIKSQLDEANKVLDTMQGKVTSDAPVGSMKYYSNWLKELQDAQQLVTNNYDWERYAGQIDFVTKKMRELRGEAEKQPEMATGLSGMTSTAIGAWIQDQQQSLDNKEIGSKGYNNTYANIVDATTFQNVLTTAAQRGIDLAAMGIDMESFWDKILGEENIPDQEWLNLQETINSHLEAMNLDPINIDVNTGTVTQQAKTLNKDWMAAASAIQSVGTAMQSIEDPAVKVLGTIAQAIASIALGAGQAIEAKSRETGNKWEWIAFAASATATMISSIAAVKSNVKGFAEGGIVPGNNFSGDNLSTAAYGINSGELILTRAQQNSIASQLQANNSGGEMQPYLDVEKIWLGLSHYTKRTGKGEIITSR